MSDDTTHTENSSTVNSVNENKLNKTSSTLVLKCISNTLPGNSQNHSTQTFWPTYKQGLASKEEYGTSKCTEEQLEKLACLLSFQVTHTPLSSLYFVFSNLYKKSILESAEFKQQSSFKVNETLKLSDSRIIQEFYFIQAQLLLKDRTRLYALRFYYSFMKHNPGALRNSEITLVKLAAFLLGANMCEMYPPETATVSAGIKRVLKEHIFNDQGALVAIQVQMTKLLPLMKLPLYYIFFQFLPQLKNYSTLICPEYEDLPVQQKKVSLLTSLVGEEMMYVSSSLLASAIDLLMHIGKPSNSLKTWNNILKCDQKQVCVLAGRLITKFYLHIQKAQLGNARWLKQACLDFETNFFRFRNILEPYYDFMAPICEELKASKANMASKTRRENASKNPFS